jgi:glutamate dehydrogenase (NAD(P)+)
MVSFSQLDSALEATADLERCARFLDLEDWIVMRLRQCEQEITLSTALNTRPLAILWVRHSSALGPAAISIQLGRDATSASERARAMQATWMSGLYGLHFGGGAATILLDPRDYNESELRGAYQSVSAAIAEIAGGSQIYPLNLNPVEMHWLHTPGTDAVIPTGAGLGPRSGGTHIFSYNHDPGSDASIAFGLLELVRCSTGKVRDLRVAIQGFNPIAQSLLNQFHRVGARIVAIADESGGLRDPLGLDPAALASHVQNTGMLLGYPGAEAVVNADVLESDCDALILAASPHQVSTHNSASIRAKFLVEAVPQAISTEVKSELTSADRAHLAASPQPFLRRSIRHMWAQLQQAATRWQLPVHTAAEMLAVQRVADAIRLKGN